MALPQTVTAGQSGHLADHDEIHELLASMDAYVNAAGFASLQAAHDALPAGGGVIYLPPGYTTQPTASVDITKPVAILGGHGAKIEHGGTSGYFDLISVSSAVDGFVCSGVIFDGRYPTRTGGGASLLLNGAKRCWVTGNRFLNSPDGDIVFEGVTDGWALDNRHFTGQTLGIKCGGENRDLTIAGSRFDTYQNACIFFDQPGAGNFQQGVVVAGNRFRNTQRSGSAGRAAIQTFGNGPSSELWFRDFKIIDNEVVNTSQPTGGTQDLVGIGLDQLCDSLVRGNTVVMVISGTGEGIVVNGPRNVICSNKVRYQSAGGIALLSYGNGCQVEDVVVCCNQIEGNDTSSGQGINFVSCNAAGNAVTGLLIKGNRCWNNGYGLQSYNDGGTLAGSNNFVVANNFTGNVTGAASFVANSGQTTTANLPTL